MVEGGYRRERPLAAIWPVTLEVLLPKYSGPGCTLSGSLGVTVDRQGRSTRPQARGGGVGGDSE